MAALGSSLLHPTTLDGGRQVPDTAGQLGSSFLPAPGLSFSQTVSLPTALACPVASPLSARPCQTLLVHAAQRGGTQLFQFQFGKDKDKEKPGRGTIILRGGKKDDQSRDGTRKIIKTVKPEEVPAAPSGLFGALAKLPFASLFRGSSADPKTIFVAGATGTTGTRVVLELLAAGFNVRAGVDETQTAEGMADIAAQYRQLISADAAKRLNFVQWSAADAEFTSKAIASAGRVVIALGADENGPRTAISPQQALTLLEAAQKARSPYFLLITDQGDTGAGSGGGGGGLFGAVFGFLATLSRRGISYSELVDEIVDSSIKFTILKTGKSDGVPDSLASTTNVVLGPEGKFTSGRISRLQVAKLVAELLANIGLGENKVIDAIALEAAEPVPISQQLSTIPTDWRRAAKQAAKAKKEAEAKEREFRAAAEAETRAVAAEAKAAAESLAALEAEAKRVAAEEAKIVAAEAKAQARAQAIGASVSDLAASLKQVQASVPSVSAPPSLPKLPDFASLVPDIPPPTPSSVAAAAQAAASAASRQLRGGTESSAEAPKQRRPLRQRKERPAPAPSAAAPAPTKAAPPPVDKKVEKNKILGGLLGEQETFFVDPDEGY